jgi:glycosyltransferase involved in cell wall biosynthesis
VGCGYPRGLLDAEVTLTVDVLIPHYNDVEGLERSLRTVRQQTWAGRFRVVVCDDGSSSDAVRRVGKVLAGLENDERFSWKLEQNGENRGRPFTRNRLLDLIDSRYVTWLDAGDEWMPEKTEAQLFEHYRRIGRGEPVDFVWYTCDYVWRRSKRTRRHVRQTAQGDQVRRLLTGQSLRAYLWTLLGTAETFRAVGRFDAQLPRLQDLDFFIRFVLHGGLLINACPGKPLATYHKSDLGRDARQIRNCSNYIFSKHRFLYEKYGSEYIASRLFDIEVHSARFALSNKQMMLYAGYMLRAGVRNFPKFLAHVATKGLRP